MTVTETIVMMSTMSTTRSDWRLIVDNTLGFLLLEGVPDTPHRLYERPRVSEFSSQGCDLNIYRPLGDGVIIPSHTGNDLVAGENPSRGTCKEEQGGRTRLPSG